MSHQDHLNRSISNNGTTLYQGPSVARFYDWSSNIRDCVKVRQYYTEDNNSQNKQDFPVRKPSKATISKMRQYYNPGVKLLHKSNTEFATNWGSSPTKGEKDLVEARMKNTRFTKKQMVPKSSNSSSEYDSTDSMDRLFTTPETDSWKESMERNYSHPNVKLSEEFKYCQCEYDPRIYPLYLSRNQGAMCIICKQKKFIPKTSGVSNKETQGLLTRQPKDTDVPPPTPSGRQLSGSANVTHDGSKATLEIFLPEMVNGTPQTFDEGNCSPKSDRTLSSPPPVD